MNEYKTYLEDFIEVNNVLEQVRAEGMYILTEENDFKPPEVTTEEFQRAHIAFTLDQSHKMGVMYDEIQQPYLYTESLKEKYVNQAELITKLASLTEHVCKEPAAMGIITHEGLIIEGSDGEIIAELINTDY